MHLNLRVVAPFSAVAALLLTTVARADIFDIVRIQHPSPEVEIVQISQPNVKQPTTDYPSVTFMPGDSVIVTATGCVQTGGIGKTWKRYVNPSGGDSERYYFGEIWIPGATGVLVPIAGVIGKTLTVPVGTTNAGLHLRLGYTDNDYSDNGYYSHDDGTENQCYGTVGEPAHIGRLWRSTFTSSSIGSASSTRRALRRSRRASCCEQRPTRSTRLSSHASARAKFLRRGFFLRQKSAFYKPLCAITSI